MAYGLLPLGALLHPEMKAGFQAHELAIRVHIFGAIFALALGPFQFSARLRARRPFAHRLMGRLYLGIGVLVGGTSGLYMAQFAFAAVMLRIYLPVSMAGGVPFESAYPVIAWLCWVPNLVVVESWLRWRGILRAEGGLRGRNDEIPVPGLR